MRYLIFITLLALTQVSLAQDSYTQVATTQESEEQISLLDQKTTIARKNIDDIIELALDLPIEVPFEFRDSSQWLETRKEAIEVYLLWYERMFELGYNLDDRVLIGAVNHNKPVENESELDKQNRLARAVKVQRKRNSIAAFLVAERRLKKFVKNSFKTMKRQRFKKLLLSFEDSNELVAKQIIEEVLNTNLFITVYDKSLPIN